jgi:UDP-glucose 4-epimerase
VSEHTAAANDGVVGTSEHRASAPGAFAVLGGTGLIGTAIVRRLLDEGCSVQVLARRPPTERSAPLLEGATVLVGSAADPTALRAAINGAEHVVDALGAPHPADSARAPLAQFDAEIPILLGVLDELRRRPGVGFTYLSSGGAIYGDVDTLPVPESTECHPVSPYGVTKLAAERYVLMAAHADGVDARILRVANAYGALQRPRTGQGVVAALLDAAVTSAPVQLFGDGSAVRDFVDVRDVAKAVATLSGRADTPSVVNVGSGTGHRMTEVIEIVESVTGTKIAVQHAAARPSDVRAVVLDVVRLKALMSWEPITLERGIQDMWESWRRLGLDRTDHAADVR